MRMASFTRDGKQVLTLSENAGLRRWNTDSAKDLGHAPGPTLISGRVKASPDGRFFTTEESKLNINGLLKTIETRTSIIDAVTSKVLGKVPGGVVFAADGKVLAVSESHRDAICLYDLPSLKPRCSVPIKTIDGPTGKRPAGNGRIFFSPDSRLLAGPQDVGAIGIWDTNDGKGMGQIQVVAPSILNGASNGAFSPDGRTVALDNGDGTVAVWEIASGNQRRSFGALLTNLRDETPTRSYLYPFGNRGKTVAFSPDGTLLSLAGLEKAIHVWQVDTGKAVAEFRGHTGVPLYIAFSPDGSRLVSGSADTTALIWDLTKVKKPSPAAPPKLTDADVRAFWQDLADSDAVKGFAAIMALTVDPAQSLPLMQNELKPPAPIDATHVIRLIAQLDEDRFDVREKAAAELHNLANNCCLSWKRL